MAQKDRRELILTRLFAILGGVDGFVGVHRNRGEIPPYDKSVTPEVANLPAAVLLDGVESASVRSLGHSKMGGMAPSIQQMEPQIFICLLPRTGAENEEVGEEMNEFRMKVLKAITTDASLIALLGSNGEMEYRGCTTDMQTGGAMEGTMLMMFVFQYVLNPAEFG